VQETPIPWAFVCDPFSGLMGHTAGRRQRHPVKRFHAITRTRFPPCELHTLEPPAVALRVRSPSGGAACAQSVAHLRIIIRILTIICASNHRRRKRPRGRLMSWMGRLRQAQAQLLEEDVDPWRRVLERALPANLVCTSTTALLALLDFPTTTGNARRLARTMRSMGWVGIKSRRLAPGGWRSTQCRGWSRPVRDTTVRKPCGPVERYREERIQK
jgi:hypothetical protein